MKINFSKYLAYLIALCVLAGITVADNTNWNDPQLGTNYSQWPAKVKDLAKSAAMMSYTSDTNIPTNVIRYNRTSKLLEQYNGSTWDAQEITGLKDGSVSTTAKLSDSTVTSVKITDGTIMNADVNSSAAIDGSKLASGTVSSTQISDGTIVNADVNASAAINGSKLASGTVSSTQITDGTIANADIADATIQNAKLSMPFSNCSCVDFNLESSSAITSVSSSVCRKTRVGPIVFLYFACTFTTAGNISYLGMNPVPGIDLTTARGIVGSCNATSNPGDSGTASLDWDGNTSNPKLLITRTASGQWTTGSNRFVRCQYWYEGLV